VRKAEQFDGYDDGSLLERSPVEFARWLGAFDGERAEFGIAGEDGKARCRRGVGRVEMRTFLHIAVETVRSRLGTRVRRAEISGR
jgi:hypothetical protein